jgi:hypothetical protein
MVQSQRKELSPERIAVLEELADQVIAGKAFIKWVKTIGLSLTAIATLGYMVLQLLTLLGWRH